MSPSLLRQGDLVEIFRDCDLVLLGPAPAMPSIKARMGLHFPPARFHEPGPFEAAVAEDFAEQAAREGRLLPGLDPWSAWPMHDAAPS